MKTATRAYRILRALSNYRSVEGKDRLGSAPNAGELGKVLGLYENPGCPKATITICDAGLFWTQHGRQVTVRYRDIVRVRLAGGKQSETLDLELGDGRRVELPVRGRQGRFYDSLEVLRFLDRVTQDVRNLEPNEG